MNRERPFSWGLRGIVFVLFLIASVALVRDTAYQGQDFEVFWRAGRALIEGRPVYALARDGGMVFKYPPWILPVFLPLAWLPLGWAKWGWGLIELASLYSVIVWAMTVGCFRRTALLVAALFWGIWAVHAMDGQITLILLAIALWMGPRVRRFGSYFVAWALTAKIFTVISLVGQEGWFRNGFPVASLKRWGILFLVLVGLSIPAIHVSSTDGEHDAFPQKTLRLWKDWREAATSGGTAFSGEKVRGRDNQGLPALVLRAAKIPAENSSADTWVASLLALFGAALWFRFSKGMEAEERWAGWLALSAVVHPLAWFHLFVLTYPAATLALDRSYRSHNRMHLGISVLGVLLLTCVTRGVLGDWAASIELCSPKSWGTVLILVSLARNVRLA